MIKILFVDDEPNVLDSFKRGLRKKSHEWDMDFVESGEMALECFKRTSYDVIISDMRMPQMNGADLLKVVSEKHPGTVRIILSGYSEVEYIMQAVRYTHQFLAKPCTTDDLILSITRATTLRQELSSEPLKNFVTGIQSLPSLPAHYLELSKVLSQENVSVKEVAAVITKDLGLTAKVLQLSNSAYFIGTKKLADISKAIEVLGYETIRMMVLAISAFSQVSTRSIHGSTFARIFSHSLRVGRFAHLIAKDLSSKKSFHDDSFIAGILHDIGKVIILSNQPERYEEAKNLVIEDNFKYKDAELRVFGVSHGLVGAYLLELWGLRDEIIEAVSFHDRIIEREVPGITPHLAVYIANHVEHILNEDNKIAVSEVNEYLQKNGCNKTLDDYVEMCRPHD